MCWEGKQNRRSFQREPSPTTLPLAFLYQSPVLTPKFPFTNTSSTTHHPSTPPADPSPNHKNSPFHQLKHLQIHPSSYPPEPNLPIITSLTHRLSTQPNPSPNEAKGSEVKEMNQGSNCANPVDGNGNRRGTQL